MFAMGWIGSSDIIIQIGVKGDEGSSMGGCKMCKMVQKAKHKEISKNGQRMMKKYVKVFDFFSENSKSLVHPTHSAKKKNGKLT